MIADFLCVILAVMLLWPSHAGEYIAKVRKSYDKEMTKETTHAD